jgi:hypothetical protein
MASTLASMRTRIADHINRTDLNSNITDAINRAIRFYYDLEEFWFTETSGTFSTVASQEAYGTADSIPSDINNIDYVKITISSTNHQILTPRTFDWIQSMNQGRSTGDPTDYAWYQNKFYFYLIPNSVKTITVFYTKTYTDLSADADTNDFLTYAEDLIEARAKWWICSEIIDNEKKAAKSKALETEALIALRTKSDKKKATNKIEPTCF